MLPAFSPSLPAFLSAARCRFLRLPPAVSLSLAPLEAPPSCLLEVGNMIYENGELNLYIFFLLHPLIYLLDFSPRRLFLSLVWRGGEGGGGIRWRVISGQTSRLAGLQTWNRSVPHLMALVASLKGGGKASRETG